MTPARARGLGETYRLARAAAAGAGVTRLADITGLAGMGLPVFQAIRPLARSLTVSQGKGATPLAAKTSALLEACELAAAEALPHPGPEMPLARLPEAAQRCWAGDRGELTIDLDPVLPRPWLAGTLLDGGADMPMPWDLLSLDFTRAPLEYRANSDGLATGNSRDEAVLSALAELVEYDLVARFEQLRPIERRSLQIDCRTIDVPQLARELALVRAAGFVPRMWSIGQQHGIAAVACKLLAAGAALDRMTPTGGSACHPEPAIAALGALREAVQGRAALVAGVRDDIMPEDYNEGAERNRGIVAATLAVTEGALHWKDIPAPRWATIGEGIALVRRTISALTPLPVVIFEHRPPTPGLHLVHALAPGLLNLSRRKVVRNEPPLRRPIIWRRKEKSGRAPRAVLFAGPSIAGLTVSPSIDLRPPAVCGDLARLAENPPTAVGLVDGSFGVAATVWHKEILDLLARGVRVLGAASLGAQRAAELESFGMEGIGDIFAAYRDGAIERDDAVMLLQAPAEFGFAPLTLALVDAEYALAAAHCPPRERRMMQRIVRTMPYQLRTWERCLAAYTARSGSAFPVPLEVLARGSTLKQQDTALLIERLAEGWLEPAQPRVSSPPLTGHYLRMLASIREGVAPVRL